MESGRVDLNVGGKRFSTSRETLCSVADTMLERMFSGSVPARPDPDGSYFIDRDPLAFEAILNALRRGVQPRKPASLTLEEWQSDLGFFGLIDAKTREDIERDAKRRKIVAAANEEMKRQCRAMYDWVVARMGQLKKRTLQCYLPVEAESLSKHMPPELREFAWGRCACSADFKAELEKLGLAVVVINLSEKISYKRCANSHFTNLLVDPAEHPPGKPFGSMPVAVVEFIMRT